MAAVSSPLSDDARKVTGDALQGALVDLIDLSLQAKQAHWNLTGRHFRSLHLQLDEVVDIARRHMDVVAERAVAIGVNPDGRASTVATSAHTDQLPDGYVSDTDVVQAFTGLLAEVGHRFRQRVADTDEPDPVSQDLLIAAAQDIEQQHWMFQAQR
ncbi:Dps family protein [Actinocatenispora rupis]|uniref:DNA starvation/stationary phase protection protein n=1 Tax=Actinocatenispora rupis TaxID=519421 RepID=A0A8J3NCE1_9ACTN|nr:DNA starvation/stationary phase protection protein [Actinocatenispora rupis]GID13956.1 DNA starvation/stationary phase protection protein [Actinocatenispora rupis]